MVAELPRPQTPLHKLQLLQHILTWLKVPVILYTSGMDPEAGILAEIKLPSREGWRICGFRATPELSFERLQHDFLRWVRLQMRSQQMSESVDTVEEGLRLLRSKGLQTVLLVDAAEVMLPGLPTMLWQWSDRLPEVKVIFVIPESALQPMQRTEPLLLKSSQMLAWPFSQPEVIMETPLPQQWMPGSELMRIWPGQALYAVVGSAVLALVMAVSVPFLRPVTPAAVAEPPVAIPPAASAAKAPEVDKSADAPKTQVTAAQASPVPVVSPSPASDPAPPPATTAPVPVVPVRDIQRKAALSAPAQPLSRVEVAAPPPVAEAAPLEVQSVQSGAQPELRPPAPPIVAPKPWELPEAITGVRGFDWIEQQNPDSYALQWVTVADFASLKEAVAAVPALWHDLASFHARRDGQDKYPLLQGVYPDLATASKAAAAVPEDLARPFPRQYRSLQMEIARLKAQTP